MYVSLSCTEIFSIRKLFTHTLNAHIFLTQLSDSCEKFVYIYLRSCVFNASEVIEESIFHIRTLMAVVFLNVHLEYTLFFVFQPYFNCTCVSNARKIQTNRNFVLCKNESK